MRIKDKGQFALGIFNILISITGLIILIVQHRIKEFSLLGICFACGITGILNGIETQAQRQKREEKLKAMAKMYGWDKDGDAE
jgi:hypothetical protein